MFNVRAKVLPVIIGVTETISKSHRHYLNNIPGKHAIKVLQKTAMLGTAHIVRKVLMLNYKTFNMRNNIICSTYSKYRTAVTIYTLEIWFVSEIQL